MATQATLTQFVRDALIAGRSRGEIQEALTAAGWSERDVERALDAFSDVAFTPPIPRPVPQLAARDAFLYLLLFSTLGFLAINLVNLLHALIDLTIEDPSQNVRRLLNSKESVRWAMAALIVAAPVFVFMSRITDKRAAREQGQVSRVRLWLTYLALFVAACVFLVDAVYVIFSFLDGEATTKFLLKAAVVAAVSSAIFVYYLRDVRHDA